MKREKKNKRPRDNASFERRSKIEEKLIKVNRVSKAIKGGRKVSFRAVVVAGNQVGQIGVGIGKANDVSESIKKAKRKALKELLEIPLTRSATIPHPVLGQFGAAKVLVMPSSQGTGVIAGGAVRTVLELAGLKNVLAKQLGSNNSLNNVKATLNAFKNLKSTTQYANLRDLPIDVLSNRIPKTRLITKEDKLQ